MGGAGAALGLFECWGEDGASQLVTVLVATSCWSSHQQEKSPGWWDGRDRVFVSLPKHTRCSQVLARAANCLLIVMEL